MSGDAENDHGNGVIADAIGSEWSGSVTPHSSVRAVLGCDPLRLDARGRLYRRLMDPKILKLREAPREPNDASVDG